VEEESRSVPWEGMANKGPLPADNDEVPPDDDEEFLPLDVSLNRERKYKLLISILVQRYIGNSFFI